MSYGLAKIKNDKIKWGVEYGKKQIAVSIYALNYNEKNNTAKIKMTLVPEKVWNLLEPKVNSTLQDFFLWFKKFTFHIYNLESLCYNLTFDSF